MACRGNGEVHSGKFRRGFSLVELAIVCAVMLSAYGGLCLTMGNFLERYSNPHSDYNVARETRLAGAWLEGVFRRSMLRAENASIRMGSSRNRSITVKWLTSNEDEKFTSDNLYFQSQRIGGGTTNTYSFSFQTLSPAMTLNSYVKKDNGFVDTGWRITISGRGFVRVWRDLP
jgi:Tfp pilus assembly protein FimT